MVVVVGCLVLVCVGAFGGDRDGGVVVRAVMVVMIVTVG